MFLVRRASDVMDKDIVVATAETDFEEFLRRPEHQNRMLHIVITRANRIMGVLRVNTRLRHERGNVNTGVTLGDVAYRNYTVVRDNDIALHVIRRLSRKHAMMAVVMRGRGTPRPGDILGVITKEHVADAVTDSIEIYPG